MNILKKILRFASHHKIISGIVSIALIGAGYSGYNKFFSASQEVRYVLAAVTKGTLISSVSGSGQISASDQVDIKAKSSGDVIYINAQAGQEVRAGQLLLQIDATDAQRNVADAEISLETAKLDLEEAESNSVDSLAQSEDDLQKAAEDGFNAIVGYFYDLPVVMADMESVLYGRDMNKSQDNVDAYADMLRANYEMEVLKYKNSAVKSYDMARELYDKNFKDYKETSRYAEGEIIVSLINETYDAVKQLSETIRNADNFISFVKDKLALSEFDAPKILPTHQSTIKTDTNKVNSMLSGLLSARRSIENSRDAITKIKNGSNKLSLRAKNISIQQREDALAEAKQALYDCYVRAPFNGMLAKINVKKGDSVSNGTAVATVITKQQVAEISLNEVDVSKVKVGQKVNLTFDAISDFTMTGQVSEVDSLGAVSQGVVTYGIKIIIDTQDSRIKPGMSVSATIITEVKQDALLIPNSALKNMGDVYYVETLQDIPAEINIAGVTSAAPPKQLQVEIGASNDSSTEIISGISDGEQIISRTVTATTKNTATTGQSIFGTGSKTSGAATGATGGANMRFIGR